MNLARVIVLVTAVSAGAFGVIRGTWAAGGSDSSCYALMADAVSRGQLQPTTSLVLEAPWPDAGRTFAPGGFIPSPRRRDAASPICSPGFSLLLAPLRAIGGRDTIFVLTPLAGAVLIWLTYTLGRQIAGDVVGAAAAIAVATMPVFLFQVVQPMNDVLVATLWMTVFVLLTRSRVQPLACGMITGLAILVRPNLALSVIPVLVWIVIRARQPGSRIVPWRAPTLFVTGLAPFIAVLVGLNVLLYGHPFSSGYGRGSDLFSTAHIFPNLRHYAAALFETQLALPLMAVAAPAVVSKSQRPVVWLIAAFSTTVIALYLLYTPFSEWWYLRFLLPALPLLVVLAIATIVAVARRPMIVAVIVAGVALFSMRTQAMQQTLDLARLEGRFRTTAGVVTTRLPANAVYVTVWESGTVRYHAERIALLWDSLDPHWLDRAIEWLTMRGFEPFIILEQFEEPAFRERFRAHSVFGNVDWPPRFEIDRQVRIFSPGDRARYLAGESIQTEIVWIDRR